MLGLCTLCAVLVGLLGAHMWRHLAAVSTGAWRLRWCLGAVHQHCELGRDQARDASFRGQCVLACFAPVVACAHPRLSAYPSLPELLQEVSALFPDPFLHLGGDEVAPGCWNSDPSVVAFMAQHNISDASALQVSYSALPLDCSGPASLLTR